MSDKGFSRAILPRLSRFVADERGSIALNFSITCTALLVMTGGAVDFARTSVAKTNLQNAADSAVLAIARNGSGASTQDALKVFATNYMAAMLPSDYDFEVLSVSRDGNLVQLTAEGSLEPGLSALAGFDSLHQSTASEAIWGTGKLEVALVLDNTGSMAEHNRMVEMKKAANALLDELDSSEDGLVKVAIVPFDVNVRVPTTYKTASWFKSDWWVSWFWKGCLADRDQNYDVSDAAVTTAAATKYPGALCSSDKLATIMPLTDNFTDLHARVNAMTPAGNTNITIGLAWGMTVLSSQEPFIQGAAPGTPDLTKIIVLMTDGANTENRWTSTASQIDARTKLACQAAKDAGITLYTVRLMEGNATLLSECASSLDTFYNVENIDDVVPAFEAIGERLSQLRVSS